MNEPSVTISLHEPSVAYRPGETLSGEYRIEHLAPGEIRAVELSVLWFTEGKGDEDMAVHLFERRSVDEGDLLDPARPGRFETILPRSPLSYDGVLLRVVWCVRVRVFPRAGKELFDERRFVLGAVAPGQAVEP